MKRTVKAFSPQPYYVENYDKVDINHNLILYESRDGAAISDSPLALFLALITQQAYDNYKHVWVVKDKNTELNFINIPEIYHKKMIIVERNSKEYVEYLLSAKYLINNSTFQSWFSKKTTQVYINTWHGTPLKAMGFDIDNQLGNTQNVLRNLLMTDYLLSPNKHTTDIFSGSGYKMQSIYSGEIIESGYPRIDFTIKMSGEDAKKKLVHSNISLDGSLPLVVYMPTWRGDDIQNPTDVISQIIAEVMYLRGKFVGVYNIIVKVHPFLYQKAKKYKQLDQILINDAIDANIVLSATDILITDFSSVCFDFLVTDKPIIFYTWDQDLYENERGLYLNKSELPGPVLKTVFEILDYLSDIQNLSKNYTSQYKQAKEKFVSYEDGCVSDRIVAYIFENKVQNNLYTKKLTDHKVKLLFYPGNLANNGITNSFINLTNVLDWQTYDITVFVDVPASLFLENYKRLSKNVRLIFRTGKPNFSNKELKLHDKIVKTGHMNELPKKAFEREAKRLFSGISFDIAIDFSGYSFYWSKYIAFSDAKKKFIFQHNDLFEEMTKVIDGKSPHAKLTSVFELYYYFDKVISVSKALQDINSKKLSQYVTADQIDFLPNIIAFDVSTQEEIQSQDIEYIEGKYKFSVSSVEIYSQAFSDQSDYTLQVSEDMIINVIASVKNKTDEMSKILINNIYYGWVKLSALKFSEQSILVEKNLNEVASFIRKKNAPIYYEIPNFLSDKKDELVTESKYVNNQYWYVHNIVQTPKAKLAHISNKMGISGWVRYDALNRFHHIKNKPYLALAFFIHNFFHQVKTSQRIKFESYCFKLKDTIKSYYTRPLSLKFSEKLNANVLSRTAIYTTNEQQIVNQQEWIKLYQDHQFIGWVKRNDIERTTDDITTQNGQVTLSKVKKQIENYRKNMIPIMINVGRLSPEKNQKLLIDAFADLIKSGVDAKLYIMGSGILEDELRMKIVSNQLSDSVELLGHIDNSRDMISVMELMDYFVFPSLYEGQGMALLEAMSLGLTPITSDIPTSREVLKDGYYGVICETNDQMGLVNAIKQAISSHHKYPLFDIDDYNKQTIDKMTKLINDY